MRALLLALALLCVPGTAMAQRVQPASADLQQMAAWAQQLMAVQQPVADAYQRCAPLNRQIVGLLRSKDGGRRESARAMLAKLHVCMADMQAAMSGARDGFARMKPLPKHLDETIHIDTGAVLRQTSASVDSMAESLGIMQEMLVAVAAGDDALAMRKAAEGRMLMGRSLEGQIGLFQAMRSAMPLETHKAMFDIRILMMRTMQAIITHDPDSDDGQLSEKLRQYGAELRLAAASLRTNWQREGQDLRNLVRQLNDPTRTAAVASIDNAFKTLAAIGDEAAAMLEALPEGKLAPADAVDILDRLAGCEMRLLEAIRAMGEAIANIGSR